MLDKLSDRARNILKIANQEARRLKNSFVGTEHLLLGILVEGGGVALKVLVQLGVDAQKMKREIEELAKKGPTDEGVSSWTSIPYTPRTKRVLEFAEEQAAKMFHPIIATEHLLLGIALEKEGLGAQVLMNFDIKTERLRDKIDELVGTPEDGRRKLEEIQARIAVPTPGPSTIKIWLFKDQLLANEVPKGVLMFQGVKVFVSDVHTVTGVPFDKREPIAASIAKEFGAIAYLVESLPNFEYASGRPWSR